MRQIVDELVDSWMSGNRKDVINSVLKMNKVKAVIVSVYIYEILEEYDKGVFTRMLESKL